MIPRPPPSVPGCWAGRPGSSRRGRGRTRFPPCGTRRYEQLDEVLRPAAVPLRFGDLIDQPPLPIPPADDWPCVGHWPTSATAATQPLSQLLGRVEDPQVRPALQTALGWLHAAAANPGSAIVGFHG
jgi:hypothetical protein